MLLPSFFYTFYYDFTIFSIMRFCFWIIVVLGEGIRISFVFARYFYSLCNPIILFFHTFVFNWETSLENVSESAKKWFKHKGGSLSMQTDSQLSFKVGSASSLLFQCLIIWFNVRLKYSCASLWNGLKF